MTSDRGSMAVAMTGAIAVLAILAVAVGAIASLYAARAQAANAADAAALAAAVATYPPAGPSIPERAARDIALANGARLVRCSCPIDPSLDRRTVEVRVAIDADVPLFGVITVSSISRAEFDPALWLFDSGVTNPG